MEYASWHDSRWDSSSQEAACPSPFDDELPNGPMRHYFAATRERFRLFLLNEVTATPQLSTPATYDCATTLLGITPMPPQAIAAAAKHLQVSVDHLIDRFMRQQ